MSSYWKNIKIAARTLSEGLKVTKKHMKDATGSRDALYTDDKNYFEKQNGLFTTQYPKEALPVPDHGRYKLHNEIDDCIVCDKCAKVCPVNCIDIEPVRAVGEIGKTSDGTSKRIYAARFDIDMAKCCFCGLCTTVCPTECLTMTDEFDFSTYNIREHNFEFGEMTPLEILQRKQELEAFNKQKEAEKAARSATSTQVRPHGEPEVADSSEVSKPKPAFRPKVPVKKPAAEGSPETKSKPMVRPKVQVKKPAEGSSAASPRPVIKPKVPVKKAPSAEGTDKEPSKSAIRPKVPVKPKTEMSKKETGSSESPPEEKPKAVRPKVPMRPKIPSRKRDDPSGAKNEGDN